MNPYNGLYLLHLKSDSEKGAVISFNRELKEEEVNLYCFDSENHRVTDPESVQDVLSFHENNTVLSMDMKENSDYVLAQPANSLPSQVNVLALSTPLPQYMFCVAVSSVPLLACSVIIVGAPAAKLRI